MFLFETFSEDVLGLRFCVFCGWSSMISFMIFAICGYLPYLGMSKFNKNPKVKTSIAFWWVVFVCLCLPLFFFGYLGYLGLSSCRCL